MPTSSSLRPAVDERPRAAIGLTVKSGWAAVVLVTGSPSTPRVVGCARIELCDPSVPESRQPYHDGFGTARARGPELSRLLQSVRRFGRAAVTGELRRRRSSGHQLTGAGVVVGSTIDPATIANDHIRIHALEGQLFRTVVEEAAARNGLPCSIWRERDLYPLAAGVLKRSEPLLRNTLAALGQEVEGPWRAEQKRATLAAWLVLAGRAHGPRETLSRRRRYP